jgi:hypothetical protein
MTTPDPSSFYTSPDGVIYPIGEGMKADIGQSSLLYNEYPFEIGHCFHRSQKLSPDLLVYIILLGSLTHFQVHCV